MVEGNGLENRHTGNRIVSSNLTSSASWEKEIFYKDIKKWPNMAVFC